MKLSIQADKFRSYTSKLKTYGRISNFLQTAKNATSKGYLTSFRRCEILIVGRRAIDGRNPNVI
jgi:hypothetical protein